MTWSGGGAPHAVWSSVVWASLTRVASYPLTNAPWSVERMHASVCTSTTRSAVFGRFWSVVMVSLSHVGSCVQPTVDVPTNIGPERTVTERDAAVRSEHPDWRRFLMGPVGLEPTANGL